MTWKVVVYARMKRQRFTPRARYAGRGLPSAAARARTTAALGARGGMLFAVVAFASSRSGSRTFTAMPLSARSLGRGALAGSGVGVGSSAGSSGDGTRAVRSGREGGIQPGSYGARAAATNHV